MSSSSGRSIAQNAAWLMLATTGQKVLAFVAFTIAARLVGRHVTGEFFYAIAVTSTFVVIADLGLTPVVIRAIASGAEEGKRLLGAALKLKAFLIPLAVVCALGYGFLRDANPTVFATIAIACVVMSADAFHLLLYGTLRGRQKLQYEAVGMFAGQVLTAVASVSAAVLGWGAPGLAFALLIASVWNVGWAMIQTRLQGITALPATKADFRLLIRLAVPFALAGLFVKVYSYLDSLMLEAFHGTASVGTYAVAYKVTYAFQFIPLVFTAALFPAMSAVYASRDKKKLKELFAGSMRIMAIVGAPLAAGISAIADRFVPTVYGLDFLGSVPVLQILPWVLLPIFLDFPIGSLLNATHRAHLKTTAMGATMVVNGLLNLFLVPQFGPVGAAWAGVASFWFLMILGLWFTWDDLPDVTWLASLLGRSAIVCAFTWIAVRGPGAMMPFPLAILFGAAIGVCALLIVRLLMIDDLVVVARWLRSRVKKGTDSIDEEAHA